MRISTKGRYALRAMIDIARQDSDQYIRLEDIAKRQNISKKYLEAVVKFLVVSGLLEGKRGKNGGYKLVKNPEEYTAWDIISVTEKDEIAPVACLEKDAPSCPIKNTCPTLSMWKAFAETEKEFFSRYSIRDLADENEP
ncbi:MAG: Rrf2 family transcriptional regulator [Lachnospiraceae bacterium]|nr:Rrf2 family transcriptional regulator [Lachnospiraceae bacterium]